jgi:hypothetical protein
MMEALLGGIDEYGFSHTVFLSQGSQQEDVRGLSALLRSHPSAGTDQLDPEAAAALKKLQERSYYFEEKQKKQEQTPEQPRSDTTDADSRKAAGHVRQPKAGEHAKQSTSSDPMIQRGRILLQGLLLFSALLALLGALLMSEMRIRIFLGIFAAVFLLSIVPVRYLLQEEELPDEQSESGRRQGRQRMQNGQNLRQTIPKFLQADTAQSTDAAQPEGAALELAALTMAMEHIRQVGTGRTRGGEQETEKRASEILCALTGGRYDRMRFGRDGRIELYTGDQSIDLQQAGRATAQQAGFAMRMAIGEYLAGGRELPVILDEAFSMYDEPHLEEALRWLKSSGRQVILFTCQRREREILRRIEQNYLGRRTV